MDPVIAPLIGFLGWIGIGAFQAFTCEKALEFHQENTPKLERRIAELEQADRENASTVARLELEKRILTGENTQLRQENWSFREQLEAARQQHQALIASGAKVSKDTQADLEDRGKWFDKELQKRQDLVDNTNIARWHEKTEYGKKLAEYQRLLRQAGAESGGLKKKLAAKETELATARGELNRTKTALVTAKQDLDKVKKEKERELAKKDVETTFLKRVTLALLTTLVVAIAFALAAIFFALRGRRNS